MQGQASRPSTLRDNKVGAQDKTATGQSTSGQQTDQTLKPGMVKGIAGNVASGGCAKWELDRREEPNVDTSF